MFKGGSYSRFPVDHANQHVFFNWSGMYLLDLWKCAFETLVSPIFPQKTQKKVQDSLWDSCHPGFCMEGYFYGDVSTLGEPPSPNLTNMCHFRGKTEGFRAKPPRKLWDTPHFQLNKSYLYIHTATKKRSLDFLLGKAESPFMVRNLKMILGGSTGESPWFGG